MTKFPKRVLRSSRRCTSSGRKPTYEIIRALKRKSASNGPAAGRFKKKILRRIVRRGSEMNAEDLLQNLTPYISTKKRIYEEDLERSEESDLHEINEKNTCPTNRIHKPRVYSRVKTNNPGVKLLKYQSSRTKTVAPCFDDDVLINTSTELKNMYHRGIKEEDHDSTDSVIQMGIEKGMKYLLMGVNSPAIRKKVLLEEKRMKRLEQEAYNYNPRLRTRLNSPRSISNGLDSRSSANGSTREITLGKH